jgi:DNA-binding response OmpR family regulator
MLAAVPSPDAAAQPALARWLASLPATCAVLGEALVALRRRSSLDAHETLTRLAHQVRSSVAGLDLGAVDAAALRVESSSDPSELERTSAALIELLRRVYAAHPRERTEILVIDDDPFIGEFMRELVRSEDVSIEQVGSAAEGLARVAERRWDLVFVDLVLPDADGRTLLADLRELPLRGDTALLVLSSKTSSLVKNECYLHGIDGFVHKPIDAATFPAMLAGVLARARARTNPPRSELPLRGDTALLVLSSKTSSLVKNECYLHGIDGFVHKPIDAATFPAMLAGVLARARARTNPPRSELPSEVVARDPTRARPRVLVAEDDVDLAALLELDLAADLDVVLARDGEHALALALASSFDLVLLDYNMPPGRNGVEVVRELRQLAAYHDTPILLLTALGSDAAIEAAFEAGASDYVTKPYTPRALLARLHRHLGRKGHAPASQ